MAQFPSDDLGATWQSGTFINNTFGSGECQAVSLGGDVVFVNSRTSTSQRLLSWSYDGGETFPDVKLVWHRAVCTMSSPLRAGARAAPAAGWMRRVHGPLERSGTHTYMHGSHRTVTGVLYFSNPTSWTSGYRANMTLSTSTDNGESWAVASIIDAGPAAYSALAFLPDGSLGLLYERMLALPNNQETYANITFTVAWEPKDPDF